MVCAFAGWNDAGEAATDSGNGNSGSSTRTRRTSETNSTPRILPTIISDVDFQSAVPGEKSSHDREITNAGTVKIAPAATEQTAIGRVDDSVHSKRRDVGNPDFKFGRSDISNQK